MAASRIRSLRLSIHLHCPFADQFDRVCATAASSSSSRSGSPSQLPLFVCAHRGISEEQRSRELCAPTHWPCERPAPVRFPSSGPHCTSSDLLAAALLSPLRLSATAALSPPSVSHTRRVTFSLDCATIFVSPKICAVSWRTADSCAATADKSTALRRASCRSSVTAETPPALRDQLQRESSGGG